MKKKWSFILALATCMGAIGCSGCASWGALFEGEGSSLVEEGAVKASVRLVGEDMLAIEVEEGQGVTLLTVMHTLQEEALLDFQMENGMLIALNGKKNDVDYNPCWMLYTSDAEMANTAWGTCVYQGKTLGSAIVGAEALPVVDGEAYVWVYQNF